MSTTTYIHVNGMKIGHVKDDVRTDYLTDALGSITATKNQSQQIVNTYRYKPYGGLLARTGTGADPKYLWTGNTGSRVTNTRFANQYNVARHYANAPAKWTTVDPVVSWRSFRHFRNPIAYGYLNGRPTVLLDPLGFGDDNGEGSGWWEGVSAQNCISIQVPVSPVLSLGLEYCHWCYDSTCCTPIGDYASKCWSLAGNATFRLAAMPWDKIGEDVRKTAEVLLRLLVGTAFAAQQCQHPEPSCVKKSRSGDFSVCIRGCAGVASISCCAGVKVVEGVGNNQLVVGCSISGGYCGLPSVSARIRVRTKVCE